MNNTYENAVAARKFKAWLHGLHKEDIRQFGEIVERPSCAVVKLYAIYKKSLAH